jgi:hypothetical protein
MAAFFSSPGFRRLRAAFRWVRILLLFAIFLMVAAGAYLHLVGLPDFLKRSLLSQLRERGFEVQFTSARLGWGPDVVIENAAFQRPDQPLGPRLSAARTQVYFNLPGLLRRRVRVDALRLSQGGLTLPFSPAKEDFLSVNDVSLDLALLPGDTIRLQQGHAVFHGIQIDLRGAVTNFRAARDWNLWPAAARTNRPPATGPLPETDHFLRQFSAILDKIHFAAPPRLAVNLTADGRDPGSLFTDLTMETGGVRTPWGDGNGLRLAALCSRPMNRPRASPSLKLTLLADDLTPPQAKGHKVYLTADVARVDGSNLTAVVNFALSDFKGHWPAAAATNALSAARLQGSGSVTLQSGTLALVAASGKLRGARVQTPWGSSESANLTCGVTAAAGSPAAQAAGGLPARFARWAADWQADLDNVVSSQIQFERIRCSGRWRAPELVLTNLEASLYGGQLTGGVWLDAGSRELAANATLDFDPRPISRLLTPAAQEWLAQFAWQRPPKVAAEASLVLPAWTNARPDFWREVLPSLRIAGDFSIGPASFRHLPIDSAQSHFTYSNQVWDLPRLRVLRPEGDLYLDFTGGDPTGDYLFVVDSRLDPRIARPLLPEEEQKALDQVSFAEPPQIHAAIRGCWGDGQKSAVTAQLTATNFTVRGEKFDGLAATVGYTNRVARVTDALVFKDGGQLAASRVEADLASKKISMSNVVSTLDPGLAVRLLGPLAPDWLATVVFDTPPAVQAEGSFVPGDPLATDLHFAVSGRNCRYSGLLAGQISGRVDWSGQDVAVTNVQAGLYGGTMAAWGVFGCAPKEGTDYRGQFSVAKIELPLLMREWSKSNRVDGVLNGSLTIAGGNTSDPKSWKASGRVFVNQALLWDIKLFGVFSPILNAIVPGSGDTRAYQASADFVVTNALLATDNLEIRSTGFRLLYRGAVTADKQLDARAEAELLRDTPFIGKMFSWAFTPLGKLFEYKIGGTLDAPTYKPLYMPKILMLMLRPFHTLKSFLPPTEPPAPSDPPKDAK